LEPRGSPIVGDTTLSLMEDHGESQMAQSVQLVGFEILSAKILLVVVATSAQVNKQTLIVPTRSSIGCITLPTKYAL
jgi:hypothetical protein